MKRLVVIALSILSACVDSSEPGTTPDAGEDTDAGPVEVNAEALTSCGPYAKYMDIVERPIQEDWYYLGDGPGRVRIVLGTPLYYKRNPSDVQILPLIPGYFATDAQALANYKNVILSCRAVLFTFRGGVQRTTSTANTQVL